MLLKIEVEAEEDVEADEEDVAEDVEEEETTALSNALFAPDKSRCFFTSGNTERTFFPSICMDAEDSVDVKFAL